MKVKFTPKWGSTEIELPITEGKPIFLLGGSGLSDFNSETFTIINQIPQAPNIATKIKWKKYTLKRCDKRDGLFDKSSGTMVYKANSFTVFVSDWEHYKAPTWLNGGYYALADMDKSEYFTVNPGDLIIFADIPDLEPETTAEFTALSQKYKDIGGIISGVNVYVNYKPDGTPWKTNHIEIIKG